MAVAAAGSAFKVSGLKGRVAVVTGGSRGIGRAIALALHAQGAAVALLDLADVDPPAGVAPGRWRSFRCDVADEASVEQGFTQVERELGPAAVLVNNAGILRSAPVLDTSFEVWTQIMRVNAAGPFLCSRRALPGMIAKGYGRIVTIASSAGRTGGSGGLIAYSASKAAAISIAKSIATEYSARGITSNAIAPAAIDTEMIKGLGDFVERIPVRRLGTPEDVAAAAVFLCSDAAGYITGAVLDVNGGFLMI
jgi:3-oxoacyl-[acyl-carrier protein] reductase